MEENLFELEVGTFNQKQLVGAMKKTSKHKKFSNGVWINVRNLEETLRKAVARRDELSLWGLGNMIIHYRIKCRLTENVID